MKHIRVKQLYKAFDRTRDRNKETNIIIHCKKENIDIWLTLPPKPKKLSHKERALINKNKMYKRIMEIVKDYCENNVITFKERL